MDVEAVFFPPSQLSPTMSICYFIYITRIQSKNKKKKSSIVQISYTEESIWVVLLTLLQATEGEGEGPDTDATAWPLVDGSFAQGGSRERGRAVGEVLAAGCLATGGGALRGESRGGVVLPLASESDG